MQAEFLEFLIDFANIGFLNMFIFKNAVLHFEKIKLLASDVWNEFTLPRCKTDRFKNSFIMASSRIVNNF